LTALAALDARLRLCGLRLCTAGGSVSFAGQRDLTDTPTRASLKRLGTSTKIEANVADLVWRTIRVPSDHDPVGDRDPTGSPSNGAS